MNVPIHLSWELQVLCSLSEKLGAFVKIVNVYVFLFMNFSLGIYL